MAGMFKDSRKTIKAFKVANRQDLAGDLRFTQSQLDAIFGNLGTTGAGIGAKLTSLQQKQLAALTRTVDRGNVRAERVVDRAQDRVSNLYGTAVAGGAAPQFGPAEAAVKALGLGSTAAAKGARTLARGGSDALAIQQAGAAEAQAGADYALAVALKSRGQADAAAAAEMEFKLQQMRIDHRYAMQEMRATAATQWQYRKRELDYLQELETGDSSGVFQGLRTSAELGADSFTGLHAIFNTPLTQEQVTQLQQAGIAATVGQTPNATQAGTLYIMSNGLDPASNEARVVMGVSRAMWGAGAGANPGGLGEGTTGLYGAGTSDELRTQLVEDAVVDSIIALYPQFSGRADDLRNAIHAGVMANVSRGAIQYANEQSAARGAAGGSGMPSALRDQGWTDDMWNATSAADQEKIRSMLPGEGWFGDFENFVNRNGLPIAGFIIGLPLGHPVAGAAIGGSIQGAVNAGNQGGGVKEMVQGAVVTGLGAAAVASGGKYIAGKLGITSKVASLLGLGKTATAAEAVTALDAGVKLPPPPAGGPPLPASPAGVALKMSQVRTVAALPKVRALAAALGRPAEEIAELVIAMRNGSAAAKRQLEVIFAAQEKVKAAGLGL